MNLVLEYENQYDPKLRSSAALPFYCQISFPILSGKTNVLVQCSNQMKDAKSLHMLMNRSLL